MDSPLEILVELNRRKEKEKIRFFTPNGKQEQFIKLVGEGNKFISIFSAFFFIII